LSGCFIGVLVIKKKEEGRRKREEGRGIKEEGRSKKEEGRGQNAPITHYP
jgi:hypothetical protein